MANVSKAETKVEYITNKWREGEKYAWKRWKDYYNDIAFYKGFQWQTFDMGTMTYTTPPIEDFATQQVYSVNNLIKPLADTMMSKILSSRPIPTVNSESKTSEAIERAEKNSQILRALWYDLNMRSILAVAMKWMIVTNHVFLRPYFDPENGVEVDNPDYNKEEAEMARNAGIEYPEPPTLNTGRICCDIFNPFQMLVDPTRNIWRDIMRYGWTLTKYIKTKDSLYSMFDKKRVDRVNPKLDTSVSTIEEQMYSLSGMGTSEARREDRTLEDELKPVAIYEYYEAPTRRRPKGLHSIVCQEELLYDSEESEEELPTRRIPICHFCHQVGMEDIWARSLVSHSRAKQKMYNLLESRLIEHTRLPALVLMPRNSGIDYGSMLGKSYQVVEYDPDEGTPGIVMPPAFPEINLLEMQNIKLELEHKWGLHEVTARSQTPTGKGMSGRGIYLLQEADVTRMAVTLGMFEESLSDFGEILLALAKKHYTEPRSISYQGDRTMEVIEFTGSKDILDDYTVSVAVSSEFMRNKQAMMEFIVRFLGVVQNIPAVAEVFNDPMVMHKIMSYISEELANTLVVKNQHAGRAEKENRLMLQGEIPEVKPWHHHPTDVKVHTSFLNSDEFMKLPQGQQDAIIEGHFKIHLRFIQAAIEEQMRVQQGLPPSPEPQTRVGGGGVFQQSGEMPTGVGLVDKLAEQRVQPTGGAYGSEERGF